MFFMQNEEYEYITVPKRIADGIEHLLKLSKHQSVGGRVETDTDWKLLIDTYKVWKRCYPGHYYEFLRSANIYRKEYSFNKGMKHEGESFIQHRLEMPETLHMMLNVMFPNLKYDREFIDRLIKELPEFKIST